MSDESPTRMYTQSSMMSDEPEGVQWSKKESELLEAWERKKRLMMVQEELSKLSDRAKPELLGRSASDCGTPIMLDACDRLKKLERSASSVDCSQPTRSFWGPARSRSLSDHDFEELKGFIDLGFQFDQNSCSKLWGTLPALEVCCAVAQNFSDSPCCISPDSSDIQDSPTPLPTPSWRIASPGDDEEEIKERLRHWAQAVACNARLCY